MLKKKEKTERQKTKQYLQDMFFLPTFFHSIVVLRLFFIFNGWYFNFPKHK